MSPLDPHEPHTSTPEDLRALVRQQRTGLPFLAWRDAERTLRFLMLDPGRISVTIGRTPDADVLIDWDRGVSRLHAELRRLAGRWVIADEGLSSNGTSVAGRRIGAHRLRDQDRITVGGTVLAFHGPADGDGACSDSTAIGPKTPTRDELTANEYAVLRALAAPMALRSGEEPPGNRAIAQQVFLTEDGVKRIMTRLFTKFGITEEPKRRRLAQRAVGTGVVTRRDVI